MLRMMGLLCFSVLIFSACFVNKQITDTSNLDNQTNPNFVFPFDWIGEYEGNLLIVDAKNDTSSVQMTLKIDYPDASGFYPWTITYDGKDRRYYGLEAINPEKGHYRIDEFNSIKIDAFLRSNHLISKFRVMNSDLLIDYERVAGGIIVTLYINPVNPMNTTGGEIIGGSTVPSVESWSFDVFQTALLKKIVP